MVSGLQSGFFLLCVLHIMTADACSVVGHEVNGGTWEPELETPLVCLYLMTLTYIMIAFWLMTLHWLKDTTTNVPLSFPQVVLPSSVTCQKGSDDPPGKSHRFFSFSSVCARLSIVLQEFLISKNKNSRKTKSSQVFTVWHTMTGGGEEHSLSGKVTCLCECEDRTASLTLTTFFDFQFLSTAYSPLSTVGW